MSRYNFPQFRGVTFYYSEPPPIVKPQNYFYTTILRERSSQTLQINCITAPAAFSALSKSMRFEWYYLQRVLPCWLCWSIFFLFETHQTNISGLPFLKAPSLIMNSGYSQFLHNRVFAIQMKVSKLPHPEQEATRNITINGKTAFSLHYYHVQMSEAMANMHTNLQQQNEVILHTNIGKFWTKCKKRQTIQWAIEGKTYLLLKSMPIANNNYVCSMFI